MNNLIIGSHVAMSGPHYFVGAIKEALSYEANTFMFYTGAPQNSIRKPTSEFKLEEGKKLLAESGIKIEHLIAHAPYIINLGNTFKEETYELAVRFLKEELVRVSDFGTKVVVLHPGAHVGAGREAGLNQIIKGLNEVLDEDTSGTIIALETMAGKGTELGTTFVELKYLIDGVNKKEQIGVCLDTCHINDAGYDVRDVKGVLDEFDQVIGLDYLKVVHINDSKNVRGAGKDRHENLGFGTIGFDTLLKYIYEERLVNIPKILETPYINDFAPYKAEIEMIRAQKFDEQMKAKIASYRKLTK